MIDRDIVELFYKDKEQDLKELLNVVLTPVRPVVTQQDVRTGYLMRYFIRPVNDKTNIKEIDKTQYDNSKSNPRFVTASIKWKIVGKRETNALRNGANIYGVGDMNRIEVTDADRKFGGLKDYIGDYLEFWFSE